MLTFARAGMTSRSSRLISLQTAVSTYACMLVISGGSPCWRRRIFSKARWTTSSARPGSPTLRVA
jgi:hypothetical protein